MDLSRNSLTSLDPDLLKNFSSLASCSLAYNNLTQLPENLFIDCAASLTSLDLSHNNLEKLELSVDTCTLLRSLNISHTNIKAADLQHLAAIIIREPKKGLKHEIESQDLWDGRNKRNRLRPLNLMWVCILAAITIWTGSFE